MKMDLSKIREMDFKPTLQVFVMSLLAFPLTYFLNKTAAMGDHRFILFAGVITLGFVTFIAYKFVRKHEETLFYVWSLFAFTSCVDLIIGLELDGHISGFMEFYFKEGEPYLRTAHGTLINWWDGTGQFTMYLILITLTINRWNCGEACLYWVGSIGNSMIVLLLGGATGTFKVRGSYLLNIPYVVAPICAGMHYLQQSAKERRQRPLLRRTGDELCLLSRPWDIVFIGYFVVAIGLGMLRGVVALGCDHEYTTAYLQEYEPYLADPNQFSKIQILTYLFYFVPYYVSAIYGLVYPGEGWMADWAYLHAGASAQSQVVHILASFHWRTGSAFKSPVDCQQSQGQVFWIINLLLLLVPQVFAWRCYNDQEFFFATKHENMSGTIITLRKHDTSEVDGKSSYSHISTTIKSEKGVVTQTQVEGRVTRSRKNLA